MAKYGKRKNLYNTLGRLGVIVESGGRSESEMLGKCGGGVGL